jgi:hypothetical protein
MDRERQQVEAGQDSRQILLPMTEVVLKVVAFVLQNVERFILDLPCVRRSPGKGYGM